jgi:hypothetical protein
MAICYEPPSAVPDPEAAQLEETLLGLCKENKLLLQRLLSYERSRQPHLSRTELLRVAIERFQRDNR